MRRLSLGIRWVHSFDGLQLSHLAHQVERRLAAACLELDPGKWWSGPRHFQTYKLSSLELDVVVEQPPPFAGGREHPVNCQLSDYCGA